MKYIKKLVHQPVLHGLTIGLAALALASFPAKATPYASGCTNDSGTIRFIMNEAGATVTVTFDDHSTLAMGVLPQGRTNFTLGSHLGYSISCTKSGTGTPFQISSDTYTNSIWANPRGIAVNKNPKNGNTFGRIYVGSSGTGGYAFGTPNFKNTGIYGYNADQTDGTGQGTNAAGTVFYLTSAGGGAGNGPWRMRVAPDNTLLVADYNQSKCSLMQFSPDLTASNQVLTGIGAPSLGGTSTNHGWFFGTPLMTGSLAQSNLVLYTADAGYAIPAGTPVGPPNSEGPQGSGNYNVIYRYDIGSGPLPWGGQPNWAYSVGLGGIANLRPEVDLGKDGKIIAGYGRANLSDPDVQIISADGTTLLYTSWASTGGQTDPWNGSGGSAAAAVGLYAGLRVTEDGRYLASVDLSSGITVASLVGGLPNDGSIFGIPNSPYSQNSRGMDWDIANNLYVSSSGQGFVRIFSLGITSTCVTSNDWSGTNGTFQLVVPNVAASVVATQPYASQNYVNSTPPGTPIPGVFRISLNTNLLSGAVTVNFTRTGTAVLNMTNLNLSQYIINTNETPNGVIIGTNSVTFPAGAFSGGGNFFVDVKITPTAFPLSTNSSTVILQISGGSTYLQGTPSQGTVFIQNTGPQLLLLSAIVNTTTLFGGGTMYRGVNNDYAKFVITRLGDTNGPGNSVGSISPVAYTITNVTFVNNATAALLGRDFLAGAQRLDPAADGKIQPPVSGPTAIVVYPGDTSVQCCVGNPVPHTNLSATPTNLNVILNMTNAVTGITNLTQEGYQYTVGSATLSLPLLDNAVGPETVLYANPLTNSADSVNWTLTFAGTNFGPGNVPVVIPNYVNGKTSIATGGTNDFLAEFGSDISTNAVPVPASPVMQINGWPNKALKMTVNKQNSAVAGVNVYPQGQNFHGNYALRFNMYLSLYDFAVNNPNIASAGREYALFGVNHVGNNCNWRPDATLPLGVMWPTNSDGIWCAIDSGAGGITPADFDCMTPGPLPNNANAYGAGGGLPDKQSNTAASQNGVFKHPPFDAMNTTEATRTIAAPGGGEPADKWVDVSMEITSQTNVNVFINKSLVIPAVALTNGGIGIIGSYTNGTIMLGYDDPNSNISDPTAFAYFSNVRVVELSPYIVLWPGLTNSLATSLIVTQGASLTFTTAVAYATAPVTNVWYKGTAVVAGSGTAGTPTGGGIQTNTANATSMTDSLTRTFNGAVDATNYMSIFSDSAGAVTSTVVSVEVVLAPSAQVVAAGNTATLTVSPVGPVAPTAYQWQTNGVSLANGTHYSTVTTATMRITNVQPVDAATYTLNVTGGNPAVTVTQALPLTVVGAIAPASTTNLWGSTVSFSVSATGGATYQWKKNGANMSDAGNVSGSGTATVTLANVTGADAATYTVGVTNGNGVVVSQGVLAVAVPPPVFPNATNLVGTPPVKVAGGNVVLSFNSPNNPYDTTNAWKLLQSPAVLATNTPWTTNTSAVWTTNGATPPLFRVTVPETGNSMFYRLLHVQ